MKEYGSNVEKMVAHIGTIEDRATRTRYAHILVELMRQIHPNMKDGQDYYNKLWDDLYIISGFTLDVDSPYPPPSPEALGRPPQKVGYNTHHLRFRHFGRNIDLLVAKAVALQDADERRAFVSYLVRLMRTFYVAWNKETVEEETLYNSLVEISNGGLLDDINLIRQEGLVESTPRERSGEQPQRISNVSRNNFRTEQNRNFRNNNNNGSRSGGRNNNFRGNNRRRR